MMKAMDGAGALLPVTTWMFSEQTGMIGSSQITLCGTSIVADVKLLGHLAKTRLQIWAPWAFKEAAAQNAETAISHDLKTVIRPPRNAHLVCPPFPCLRNIPSNNHLGVGLL